MNIEDYILVRIDTVSFEEFFNLIKSNESYIEKGFAGTVRKCATKEGAKELFDEWISEENEGNTYSFFIKHVETNNLVGLVNIQNVNNEVKKCELGYFISQQATGKGIVTCLTKQVVTFCFESLQMNKVLLRISPENIGSQKVALKLKFKQEGILREEYLGYNNTYEDLVYFGMLKSEYLNLQND